MISKLRTFLFWLHLTFGVVAGLFILNLALSGILIAYASSITAFIERNQRHVAVSENAARLDVETLVARVQQAQPEARLSAVAISSDPAQAAMFFVEREQVLFANPYTGDVLGAGNSTARGFFHFMTDWHRWLAQEGKLKPIGQTVTGSATIAYFVLLLSGLCLWLPRQFSWTAFKAGLFFNLTLRGKARDWNWHNVIGFWTAPLLLLVTLTGIIMSFSWANNLLFRLAGSPPPEQRRREERTDRQQREPLALDGLNALWATVERQVPDWKTISLRLSSSPDAPANFTINRGEIGRPDLLVQATFDRATGEVRRWQPYDSQPAGRKLRSWVRPLHTGELAGLAGETLAVLAAAGGLVLVWTGLALAWRRFFSRKIVATTPPLSQPNLNLPSL